MGYLFTLYVTVNIRVRLNFHTLRGENSMRAALVALAACSIGLFMDSDSQAQVGRVTYFAPVTPVTTFYAPVAAVPTTTFFHPAPAVHFQPVPVATTRHRPILGGTVTRVRTAYRPVVVNQVPIVFGF